MKRTITSIFAIMLALVMVLSLAACGGSSSSGSNEDTTSSNKNPIVGKWELSSSDLSKIESHNRKIPSPENIENNGNIEFFEDGSCDATIYDCNTFHTSDGDTIPYVHKYDCSSYYTKENGRLYLSMDGNKYFDYKYTISDNQLIITMDVPNSSYDPLLEVLTYKRVG